MALGEKQQYAQAVAGVSPLADGRKSLSQQFIDDDCEVVECRDGFIHVEENGRQVATLHCPTCNRSGIPSLRPFKGEVTRYSPEEMADRRQARVEFLRQRSA